MAKRYRSFSKYLEGEYYNEIAGELELYIADNGRGLNLYSCSVPDPQEIELNDFRVMSVNFRDTDSSQLIFTASIRAEIDIPGCESEDYENRRLERWFSVSFTATLRNGLRNVEIQRVCEYTKERFNVDITMQRAHESVNDEPAFRLSCYMRSAEREPTGERLKLICRGDMFPSPRRS